MNILVVNRDLSIGGGSTYIHSLCRILTSNGSRVTLLAAPGPMYQSMTGICSEIRRVPLVHPIQGPWLSRFLRSRRIDVVNVHSRTQARVAHPVCQQEGIPLVMTMHGPIGAKHHAALQPVYASAAGVMVMNEQNARYCVRYGVTPSRIFLTRLMLDWGHRNPRPARQARTFTYCSRLSGLKGPKAETWLRAVALLGNVPDWRLVMIGDGHYRRRLEDLSKELGLNVSFMGSVTQASRLFDETDVLTGSGYVAIEGLRSGCGVVGLGYEGCTGAVTEDSLQYCLAMNFGDNMYCENDSSPERVASSLRAASTAVETGEADRVSSLARAQCSEDEVAGPVSSFFECVGRQGDFIPYGVPYSLEGDVVNT